MSSISGEILNDISQTLRTSGLFKSVSLGLDHTSVHLPRAEVILVSVQETQPDDAASGMWYTLVSTIRIHLEAQNPAESFARGLELVESAQQALLVDRFRNQLCQDLPIGKATEFGAVKLEPPVKSPNLVLSFDVRCHYFSDQGSGQPPQGQGVYSFTIESAAFGQTELSSPISIRIARRAEPLIKFGDDEMFSRSVQLDERTIQVELRLRNTTIAENLSLGQADVLSIHLSACGINQTDRNITITDAVLIGMEMEYAQATNPVAKLTFLAEAQDGNTDPFFAEDAES